MRFDFNALFFSRINKAEVKVEVEFVQIRDLNPEHFQEMSNTPELLNLNLSLNLKPDVN